MRKYHLTLLLVPVIWVIAGQWTTQPTQPGAFAGSAVCASCHKDIYAAHIQTAHYLDSRPASAAAIKGSFKYGHNRFVYNDHMEVELEKKDGRFYQTALFNGNLVESEAFAIVIGSGRKGQAFSAANLLLCPAQYLV
jgi:hypothetical protein